MVRQVSAQDVRQYALCPCALYLEFHGPTEEMVQAHAFVEHLKQLGLEYEQTVVASLPHVDIPPGPLPMRAKKTLELLQQGVERIYHPVLLGQDLVGVPDFLERTDIPSDLGSFSYRPVDVKISTAPKPEHEDQLGFYGLLLAGVQGLPPQTGDLILVDQSRATLELAGPIAAVEQMLGDVRAVMDGRRETPTRSEECGMCPWHDYCLEMLYASEDISLVDGLGREKKKELLGHGYRDWADIAGASCVDLCRVPGIGQKTAERMIMQAATLLEGRPRILSAPKLPDAGLELYLDMECQQETQVIYLIGVLECPSGSTDEFRAFVADRPEDEDNMWGEFLEYLRSLPFDLVIYHYASFEGTHLRKLAERYGIDPQSEEKLFGALVDLHPVMKASVVLPLHSYGLKPVAKSLGFKWTETAADAAMSMLWFDLWLSTGDRKYLELSVEYNEDDCRATKAVKEWLASVGG